MAVPGMLLFRYYVLFLSFRFYSFSLLYLLFYTPFLFSAALLKLVIGSLLQLGGIFGSISQYFLDFLASLAVVSLLHQYLRLS